MLLVALLYVLPVVAGKSSGATEASSDATCTSCQPGDSLTRASLILAVPTSLACTLVAGSSPLPCSWLMLKAMAIHAHSVPAFACTCSPRSWCCVMSGRPPLHRTGPPASSQSHVGRHTLAGYESTRWLHLRCAAELPHSQPWLCDAPWPDTDARCRPHCPAVLALDTPRPLLTCAHQHLIVCSAVDECLCRRAIRRGGSRIMRQVWSWCVPTALH